MGKKTFQLIASISLFIIMTVASTSYSDNGPSYPKRIISLAPSLTEELYCLGVEDKIVGVTTYCQNPPAAMDKEKVGTATEVNLEEVLSLEPDLVVAASLTNPKSLEKMKNLGINIVNFPKTENLAQIIEQFLELGKIVGREEEAGKIALQVKFGVSAVVNKIKNAVKKSVFVEIGSNPLFTVTKDSFINDMITFAGGENTAVDSGTGLYSREKVIEKNPDVIIISTMGMAGFEEKEEWQKFKFINAVKNNQIYIMDSYKLCSPTPLSFLSALEEMAARLHNDKVVEN